MSPATHLCVLLLFLISWKDNICDGTGIEKFYRYTYPELYYTGAITGDGPEDVSMNEKSQDPLCRHIPYEEKRYRQIDGTCNNRWGYGTTMKAVKRYLPPHYQDEDGSGRNAPRIYSGIDGSPLPSPRDISLRMHPERNRSDHHTLLVMQLGQLLDHDITSAPIPTETSEITCCGVPRDQMPDECFPIKLPRNDPHFTSGCMEFVRSEPFHDDNGTVVYPREQMNALTSFVDGSCFYGSDTKTNTNLRTNNGTGALLRTIKVNGEERLPEDRSAECLSSKNHNSYCQMAGDKRVNEQPYLGTVHTMFHLYHNNIVRALARGIQIRNGEVTSPDLLDDYIKNHPEENRLFQEARKIMVGIWEKIVYCDWLPIVLGRGLINKFQLGCSKPSEYKPDADPRIANVFLTAAFRFGHSLIPNKLQINHEMRDLKNMFMIPDNSIMYYDTNLEGMVANDSQEALDRFMSSAVTSHLFETVKGREGALDLVSLNIQRGRDHGTPSYFYWRRYYHEEPINSFRDLKIYAAPMKKLYKDITDIDLFPAGLQEKHVPGGMVGETFGNIIGNQFADLKFGDRYFFTTSDRHFGFTEDQLQVIRSVDMAQIFCQNSAMTEVQQNPFYEESDKNPYVSCSSLPTQLNVAPWMENW